MNMQDWEDSAHAPDNRLASRVERAAARPPVALRLALPPAGEITEVVGRLSSGRTSLCSHWLAAATSRGGVVALVDTDHTLDPPSAERAGVDLRRLLWIRCRSRRDLALAATDALVRCPGFCLVVLDTGEIPPRLGVTAAFRLKLAVRRSDVALVVLTRRRISGPAATVALETVQDGLDWTATGSRLVA